MTNKTKPIYTIFLIIIWLIGYYLIFCLIFPTSMAYHISMEGVLIGVIFIAFYQQKVLINWVYRLRYLINAIALGLGCLFLGLLNSFFWEAGGHLFLRLAFDFAAGFTFGLFLALMDFRLVTKRKKTIPYSGSEIPVLTSKAYRSNFDQSFTPGRALLLSGQLVFLSAGSSDQKVLFSEIINMETGRILGFPNKLILFLKDAESLTITLSMPYIWKKKITESMNLNPGILG
ncbi:MAG: hypothetical protein NTV01_00915 [Bacteroidia bacterium]|nr:hypothetical protein [Bacteroidia bacterium]